MSTGTDTAARLRRATRRDAVSGQFVRYVLTGGASVVVDVALLALLHGVLHVELVLATAASYALVLGLHYTLNRRWAFQADGDHSRQLPRYLVTVVVEFGITVGVVALLTDLGVEYLLAKLVAVAVIAAANFLVLRSWVFAAD